MEKSLVEWGLTDVVDNALLLVSELVTNAVQHAPHAGIGFTATRDEGLLLIEVQDGSADAPVLRHEPADMAESGRGLGLVDSLADDWGWMSQADGTKSTWALITVPPADGSHTSPDTERH
jgi:anti-sigma regulatory factor (Ser/Thr protein kinase)